MLNRARRSALAASRQLLALLLRHLDPGGPLVFGLDETIERRAGPHIEAKGVYRDAVRSSHSHFVKAMGLHWLSLMWLVRIPWAGRVWALPFLTVLAPSARYHAEQGRRHKTLTNWARQMLCLLRRWLPDRTYATLRLLAACHAGSRSVRPRHHQGVPQVKGCDRPAPRGCAGAACSETTEGAGS